MGDVYQHLTIEERCELGRLHTQGYSMRQIATIMDRSPSTISRELNRNVSRKESYNPVYADEQAWARRWCGSKLDRDPDLRHLVFSCLQRGRSPQQVAGRLALEEGRTTISHETIYRFVQAQIDRKKDFSWRHLLPRSKAKRGFRGRKGGSPASFFHYPPSPAPLPAPRASRRPGHSRPLGGGPDALRQ